MEKANLPENEVRRVAALHGLGILDTPREDRFDRYTCVAAQIFDVPIALISLVDRDRQWFKSAKGLDVEETPRNSSFCGHSILGDGVFEVRDARRDPRFEDERLSPANRRRSRQERSAKRDDEQGAHSEVHRRGDSGSSNNRLTRAAWRRQPVCLLAP